MAELTTFHSWREAYDIWRHGSGDVKIGYKTYIRGGMDQMTVLLHGNPILAYSSDGNTVWLSSAGHLSVTTLDRLRQLLPEGWGIRVTQGQWWVTRKGYKPVPFEDGLRLRLDDPNAIGVNWEQLDEAARLTVIENYARKYWAKLWARQIRGRNNPIAGSSVKTAMVAHQFPAEIGWAALNLSQTRPEYRLRDSADTILGMLLENQNPPSSYRERTGLALVVALQRYLKQITEVA